MPMRVKRVQEAARWLRVVLLLVAFLVPGVAFGGKIAVLRGPYTVTWEKEKSEAKAQLVADAVAGQIRDTAGWEAIVLDRECTDLACLTGALAITCGVLEGVGASRHKDLGSSDDWDSLSEWKDAEDSYHRLQVGERVVFGVTLAAAVTTGVLAFFTDFKRENKTEGTVRLPVPVALQNGGLLVWQGDF